MNDTAARGWAEPLATGMALADERLRLLWVNPALAELLDIGPRSAVGQSLGVLLHRPEWMALASRALQEPSPHQLRGIDIPSARGEMARVDVSMQRLASGELLLEVHALAPPAPSATPLSATLRGFAHEVKNPLAGLRGAAQLLQRRVEDEQLRSLAGLVIAEADRLAALANRLLHHDGAAAQLGDVNIHVQLERLGDLLLAEAQPPTVRHDYDPSLPDIYGDADRLLQLLLNLARNAVEAGARTLLLRTRAEPSVRLGERMARMALRVDVVDDGPGVPEHLRDTLFEPLVSGRADGSGLGLALAREIAREHGGELRHVGRPGETTFSLYLPMGHAHD
ncbi:two-component system sensor histidine kinase NtrB [Dyella japonica]|uniref:Sensory histidine kinase/phosphatase NtrB n=1 Tax=Dyella japonica DSM 16301 TaxID=1440762 RepID=A0A0G9H206_9GAMM|nr:ATP-binding protein [Dyella japonica]KLD63541.1 histidine kinase [Dyella japonica DSM 16301]